VLARPDAGGAAELAVPAKRDAVALYRTAIVADCADFVRDAGFGAEAIACGIRTLRQTLQEEVDLGTLGGRDPAAAACGETWKGELDVHAAEFQRLLLAQRDRFGVAVFGFHRQYGFAGGAGEEFCRRFAAALPGAPRALLEPGGELPEAWRALLRSCGEIISVFELRPLLRWCIVDRADEILGRGTAEPCEPFAGPGDVDGLRQIVRELRALGPAANTRTPAARPPSGTSGEASGAAGTRILTGYPGDDDRERVSGTRAPAPSHDARPPSTGGRTTLIDTSFP
jgi:hypothetical protein